MQFLIRLCRIVNTVVSTTGLTGVQPVSSLGKVYKDEFENDDRSTTREMTLEKKIPLSIFQSLFF
jgi:hypothetical protein